MDDSRDFISYVSRVSEINDISNLMQDKHLDEALGMIIKLGVSPNVAPQKVPQTIVLAQSLSAELKIKGKYYMIFDKDERDKKNMYLSVAEEMDKLANSLKYLVRGM